MKTARTILILTAALLIVSPLGAAEGKKGAKKPPKCPAADRVDRMLEGITLTDEQKAKITPITQEFGPKFVELNKQIDGVLKPEQIEARKTASKAAKDAGKTGKDAAAAVDAAMKLTDEQKTKMAGLRKEMAGLDKGLREKVMAVLTPEQQQKIKSAKKPVKAPKNASP